MSRMTVRELRQKWPEVERRLASDGEVIVTRDDQPIARLLPYAGISPSPRERFCAAAHLAWLDRFWAGESRPPRTDDDLRRDRAD